MEKLFTSSLKLGIIAGGQLGKMLIQDASKWNIATYVLDAEVDCPAGGIATKHIKGSHLDYDDVYAFGKMVDVLTYEMENINIDALKQLKAEGTRIVPDPHHLEMIQDKGIQKQLYQDHHIPTSPFHIFADDAEIRAALEKGLISYPFVQKIRQGGYDGRGVAVIDGPHDLHKLFAAPSLTEEKVSIDKEIAVIAARNGNGEIRCFPAVEMVFDPVANLVEKLICPSTISDELAESAAKYAARIIDTLQLEGLLAVEFFVDEQGKLLVNEVAPRPHNSGHHTIESVVTSQFEQHLRAILNLPLGSTRLKIPAVMINLLGEEGHDGPVLYEGLNESLAIEGVKIHLYGKKYTRHFRKMGHITVIAPTLEEAIDKANQVKDLLKVKSVQ